MKLKVVLILITTLVIFIQIQIFKYYNKSIIYSTGFTSDSTPKILKEGKEMSTGFRNVGYFVNWGIYARGYLPQQIPAAYLTHLLYAFANVNDDGEVILSDSYSDEEIHWEGDSVRIYIYIYLFNIYFYLLVTLVE